jgi:hypothetical protein
VALTRIRHLQALFALVSCARSPQAEPPTHTTVADGAQSAEASPIADASPTSNDAAATPDVDPATAPDAAPDGFIATTPPIALPGLALWLDGNSGPVSSTDGLDAAWLDRSGHGMRLDYQGRSTITTGRMAGQKAVQLNGQERFLLSPSTDDGQRQALTIGDGDFLFAVVIRRDYQDFANNIGFALSPWLDRSMPSPETSWVSLGFSPNFDLTLHSWPSGVDGYVSDTSPLPPLPHLLVARSIGADLDLRLDGQTVDRSVRGRLSSGKTIDFPFLPVYVGAWDFDISGFKGLVGEVVIVIGPETQADTAPLEAYLRNKYGI